MYANLYMHEHITNSTTISTAGITEIPYSVPLLNGGETMYLNRYTLLI